MGALQNHLCPVSEYSAPGPGAPRGIARVVLARTSDPPCFSVIAIPKMALPFSPARDVSGRRTFARKRVDPKGARARVDGARPARQRASSKSGSRDPRRPDSVIRRPAGARHVRAGTTRTPRRRVQSVRDRNLHQPMVGRDNVQTLSSMRFPKRSKARNSGGKRLASKPHAIASALPARRPSSESCELAQSPTVLTHGARENWVAGEDVVAGQRRRLIGDLVGTRHLLARQHIHAVLFQRRRRATR